MRSIALSAILLMVAVFAAASPIISQNKRQGTSVIPPLFLALTSCLRFP